MGTDICSGKLFVKAAEVALSPSASKDCMQLSPAQPKRQLEVQLSEVRRTDNDMRRSRPCWRCSTSSMSVPVDATPFMAIRLWLAAGV